MSRRFPSAPLPLVAVVVLCLAASARPATAAPVLNVANGHYYDKIDSAGITWSQADTAANAMSYLGMQGHLVTITSAQENLFVSSTFGAATLTRYWTGGYQPPGSPEPAGGWSWVTGEPFVYNNWAGGEPNNSGGEDRIVFDHGTTVDGRQWNDLPGGTLTPGYVVEFEPTPEPATVVVFLGLGAVTLVRTRRSVRRVESV